MAYYARVECDSLDSYGGNRCTSFIITFPRVVLAEVVTHRASADGVWDMDISVCERTTLPDISKNSASSRAIPFEKMLKRVQEDPFMPFWTLNQKGMQGVSVSDAAVIDSANRTWLAARDQMIRCAEYMHDIGIHKQDVNRLLEPWMWVTQVVTSSRWDNFFALRCHKAAHPAFQRIARMMYLARRESKPTILSAGEWHLPFVKPEEKEGFLWVPPTANVLWPKEGDVPLELPLLIRKSAARCAWVSYENHDKVATDEAHVSTFNRLTAELPVHCSPAEHQVTPMHPAWYAQPKLRSNITGFLQARKLIRSEEITEYNPPEEEIQSWNIQ